MKEIATTTETLMREEVRSFVKGIKGKFFTVNFTKKNGDNRTMNCRTGVKKHLAPAGSKGLGYDFEDKGLIGVWTTEPARHANDKGYRCFAVSRLIWIRVNDTIYKIV